MVDLLEARRRILLNTPHLESLSGAMASFETDMSAKLKECKVYFTPIQEGSGDQSPENVRPIHGWDSVTVTRCGKNLVNYIDPENIRLATSATLRCKGNTDYGSISIADGVVTLTRVLEAAGLCFILGELKAGVTYTLSGTWDNTDGKAYIALLDTDIADEYSCTRKFTINFYYGKATFTPEETGVYEVLIWRGGRYAISASNVQLEVGSTATDYEPYTATTLTIPFPQTIYGGYVDLVKGEVVEEIDSEGQQITPNSYSITPQTIRTLKGLNSIWSDANGNIELKFWTH